MYRVYGLTDQEKGKVIWCRWDGDTEYYDVFDSQEECDKEQKRLDQIDADYKREKEEYLKNVKGDMKDV